GPLQDLGARARAEAEAELRALSTPLPVAAGEGVIPAAGPCVRPDPRRLRRVALRWLERRRVEAGWEDDGRRAGGGCAARGGVVVAVGVDGRHSRQSAVLRVRGDEAVELARAVGTSSNYMMEWSIVRGVGVAWLVDVDGDGRLDAV